MNKEAGALRAPTTTLQKISILSIDYDEFQPLTYRGVELHTSTDAIPLSLVGRFASGIPSDDILEAKNHAEGRLMVSSTVDNFISDLKRLAAAIGELR